MRCDDLFRGVGARPGDRQRSGLRDLGLAGIVGGWRGRSFVGASAVWGSGSWGFAGWWLGDVYLGLFGPSDAGLDSLAYTAAGAAIGGMAGILIGAFVVTDRTLPSRQRFLLGVGAVVVAGIAMTGLWWVGDLTNADGPGSNLSYVWVAIAPVALGAYITVALRMSRSARGRARRS